MIPPPQCPDPFVHHLRREPVLPCYETEASLAQPINRSPSHTRFERLTAGEHSSVLETLNRLPPHMRKISFDLHGSCWTSAVITQLGEVLAEFSDVLSKLSLIHI